MTSEARTNEADTSSRSARESGLAALKLAIADEIKRADERLWHYEMKNMEWQKWFTRGQLDVWRAMRNRLEEFQPPDAPSAAGERALARNEKLCEEGGQ